MIKVSGAHWDPLQIEKCFCFVATLLKQDLKGYSFPHDHHAHPQLSPYFIEAKKTRTNVTRKFWFSVNAKEEKNNLK